MGEQLEPGYSLSGDDDGRWPMVIASPHSGRAYPASLMAATRLSLGQMRRAEDAFVDQLLEGISGVPVMTARWSRLFLDLNRHQDELDPEMLDRLPARPLLRTDRLAAGLGLLPRIAGHGLPLYRAPLSLAEAEARIAAIHRPWHHRLEALLAAARARHGYAILIDCHSMPRPAGPLPPQIVLGDRHGSSAAPALVALIEQHFIGHGWRVARNNPYAGGHTTERHGRPLEGLHCVQIEIDRSLYMDPVKLLPGPGFVSVARQLQGLVRLLLAHAPRLPLAPGWREAAE